MSTFVIKNLEINILDERSIQDAIDYVEGLKAGLATALARFCEELTFEGQKIAKAEIERLGAIDSGTLHESIDRDYENHTGYVFTNNEYAIYVEFGTGVVGAGNPHPLLSSGDYDLNHHGDSGWVYRTDEEHAMFTAKDGTPLAWTKGMPQRPYMYNTFRQLFDMAEQTGGRAIIRYIP